MVDILVGTKDAVIDQTEVVLASWIPICHLQDILNYFWHQCSQLLLSSLHFDSKNRSPGISLYFGNICKDFRYTVRGCPVLQELPPSISKCRIKCHYHLYKKCDYVLLPIIWGLHGQQSGFWWDAKAWHFETFLPSQVVEPPTALVSEAFPMVAKGKAASKSGWFLCLGKIMPTGGKTICIIIIII